MNHGVFNVIIREICWLLKIIYYECAWIGCKQHGVKTIKELLHLLYGHGLISWTFVGDYCVSAFGNHFPSLNDIVPLENGVWMYEDIRNPGSNVQKFIGLNVIKEQFVLVDKEYGGILIKFIMGYLWDEELFGDYLCVVGMLIYVDYDCNELL